MIADIRERNSNLRVIKLGDKTTHISSVVNKSTNLSEGIIFTDVLSGNSVIIDIKDIKALEGIFLVLKRYISDNYKGNNLSNINVNIDEIISILKQEWMDEEDGKK